MNNSYNDAQNPGHTATKIVKSLNSILYMYLNSKGRIKIKSIADDKKKKQSIVSYSPLIVVFVFTSVNGLWILFGKIKKNPKKILHYV